MRPDDLRPILVLEDCDEDFATLIAVLRERGAPNPVHRAVNGEALIELVRGGQLALAAFVLLNLSTPGMDGREVLVQLKSDPDTRAIPVIVLTTSSNARDVSDCYAQGANAYHLKLVRYDEYRGVLRALLDYWLRAVVPWSSEARAR